MYAIWITFESIQSLSPFTNYAIFKQNLNFVLEPFQSDVMNKQMLDSLTSWIGNLANPSNSCIIKCFKTDLITNAQSGWTTRLSEQNVKWKECKIGKWWGMKKFEYFAKKNMYTRSVPEFDSFLGSLSRTDDGKKRI